MPYFFRNVPNWCRRGEQLFHKNEKSFQIADWSQRDKIDAEIQIQRNFYPNVSKICLVAELNLFFLLLKCKRMVSY